MAFPPKLQYSFRKITEDAMNLWFEHPLDHFLFIPGPGNQDIPLKEREHPNYHQKVYKPGFMREGTKIIN